MKDKKRVLIRGGGDLASGVAAVLHRTGWEVVISELAQPLVVRRKVAFAEAVWEGHCRVEEIEGKLVSNLERLQETLSEGNVAVLVDPELERLADLGVQAVIDARMIKRFLPDPKLGNLPLIGLGPGFVAGENCHVVIETNRGEDLGRVIWEGSAQENTGVPGIVCGFGLERVLYAPADGNLETLVEIGDRVVKGQVIARIAESRIVAPFDGLLRGMARAGLTVNRGTKVGDVDPRMDLKLCYEISDKAIEIGNGAALALRRLIENLSYD